MKYLLTILLFCCLSKIGFANCADPAHDRHYHYLPEYNAWKYFSTTFNVNVGSGDYIMSTTYGSSNSITGRDTIAFTGTSANALLQFLNGVTDTIYLDMRNWHIPRGSGGSINLSNLNLIKLIGINTANGFAGDLFKAVDNTVNNIRFNWNSTHYRNFTGFIYNFHDVSATTYNSSDPTTYRQGIMIDGANLDSLSGGFFFNGQDDGIQGLSYMLRVSIYNCILDSTYGGGEFIRMANCWQSTVHDCRFTNINFLATPANHASCIYGHGDADIYNCYFLNTWGNNIRWYTHRLKNVSTGITRIWNIISINKTKYPAIELNWTDADTTGGNHKIAKGKSLVNFVSVHGTQDGPGNNSAAIVDDYSDSVYVHDCAGTAIMRDSFPAITPTSTYILHVGTTLNMASVDTSGNVYAVLYTAFFTDTFTLRPKAITVIIVATGTNVAWRTRDINGYPVPSHPSKGAVEYPYALSTPIRHRFKVS